MRDVLKEEIMETVYEYNETGEEIYLKKLTVLFNKRTSQTTLHKKVRQLVEDGHLVEKRPTNGRGVSKNLYIPKPDGKEGSVPDILAELSGKLDMLIMFFGISSDLCNDMRKHRRR